MTQKSCMLILRLLHQNIAAYTHYILQNLLVLISYCMFKLTCYEICYDCCFRKGRGNTETPYKLFANHNALGQLTNHNTFSFS